MECDPRNTNNPGPARPAAAEPPRVPSAALLRGGREVVIEHNGRDYRLRVTSNEKLILTA